MSSTPEEKFASRKWSGYMKSIPRTSGNVKKQMRRLARRLWKRLRGHATNRDNE